VNKDIDRQLLVLLPQWTEWQDVARLVAAGKHL